MQNHVMIDLETLGTSANSKILSIGAVRFDPCEAYIGPPGDSDTFYCTVDLNSQNDRVMSHSTLEWWFSQPNAARSAFATTTPVTLSVALINLHVFIATPECVGVWGNGADFDNAILQHAWYQSGLEGTLWPYKANRCFRTFVALTDPQRKHSPGRNSHHALEDAVVQAHWMKNICQEHGLTQL